MAEPASHIRNTGTRPHPLVVAWLHLHKAEGYDWHTTEFVDSFGRLWRVTTAQADGYSFRVTPYETTDCLFFECAEPDVDGKLGSRFSTWFQDSEHRNNTERYLRRVLG